MAMTKLSPGITEITGTTGGTVYRRDRCGQHTQSTQRRIKRQPSAEQKKRRRAWITCQSWIQKNLTAAIMMKWSNYANLHPKNNKLGETIRLTWWQAFLSINLIRVYNGLEVLPEPPQ